MEYVEGRIFWELDLPGIDPDERAAIYDSAGKTIAQLHNFDHEHIGLGDYGKPGNYFARQISRWSKQYYASEIEKLEVMDKLIAWLPEHIPEDERAHPRGRVGQCCSRRFSAGQLDHPSDRTARACCARLGTLDDRASAG
jgi:aminoglycoside phosphotransferase (APT) family kinase protein